MSDNPYQQRVEAVKSLLVLFRLERAVYIIITLISLAVMLVSATVLLVREPGSRVEIIGLFGSAGGIAYSAGRLLKMWSEAMKVLLFNDHVNR